MFVRSLTQTKIESSLRTDIIYFVCVFKENAGCFNLDYI